MPFWCKQTKIKIQVYLFTDAQIIILRVNVHSLHRIWQMAQLRAEKHLFCVTISTDFCSQRPINYPEILLTADISLCSSWWHTFKQQSWNLLCWQFEWIKRWDNQGKCLLVLLHQSSLRQREWKENAALLATLMENCSVMFHWFPTWLEKEFPVSSFHSPQYNVLVAGSTSQHQKSKPPAYTHSYK